MRSRQHRFERLEGRLLFAALDPTWNGSGIQGYPFLVGVDANKQSTVLDVAVQPDQKVLALNNHYELGRPYRPTVYTLIRYNVDGSVDTTFGPKGDGIIDLAEGKPQEVLVQDDGTILLSFASGLDRFIQARKPDGSLDTSFGDDGLFIMPAVEPPVVGSNFVHDLRIALTPDGDLYAAHAAIRQIGVVVLPNNEGEEPIYESSTRIVRLNADGSPDSDFDGDGVLIYRRARGNDMVSRIAVQPTGHLVMIVEGELDRISPTGARQEDITPEDVRIQGVYGLATQSDGKILIASPDFFFYENPLLHVTRLNPDGSLDTTYGGGDGVATSPRLTPDSGTPSTSIFAVDAQDRAVIAVGHSERPTEICRFTPRGTFDPTLNSGDLLSVDIFQARSMDIGAQDTIVIGTAPYHVVRLAEIGDVTLTNDSLFVRGTGGDDTLEFSIDGEELVLLRNGDETRYPLADVRVLVINSGSGDDVIDADALAIRAYVNSGSGDDRVFTGSLNDTIETGAGYDAVWANDGRDKILGGAENDTLRGGAQNDTIFGMEGNDRLNGNGGNDRLFDGAGRDRLFGYAGNDWLDAGPDDDFLDGGVGADTMYGGNDDDRYFADDGFPDHLISFHPEYEDDSANVDASDIVNAIETTF